MMTPAPQPNATPNMYNSNPGKTGRNYFHSSKSSPQCSSKAEDKKKKQHVIQNAISTLAV